MSNDAQMNLQNLKDSEFIRETQKEIDKEKKMTRLLRKSAEQWNSIVSDLEKGYGNTLTAEEECKIRFMQLKIYNDSLQTQITSMRTELRMLKNRRSRFLASVNLNRMGHKDVRQHLENLEKELASLKCLRSMYERQLDQESQKYCKAKEERDSIIKDVWFQQQSRIDEQEKIDKASLGKYYGPKPKKMSRQRPKTSKVRITGSSHASGNLQRPDSYQSIHARNVSHDKIPSAERSVTTVGDEQYFNHQTGQRYSEINEIEDTFYVGQPERNATDESSLSDIGRNNYVARSEYMPGRDLSSENFLPHIERNEDFYRERMETSEHLLPKIERKVSRESFLPMVESRENIVRSSQRKVPSGHFLPQIERRHSREQCDIRSIRDIRNEDFRLPEIERRDSHTRNVSGHGRDAPSEYALPDIEKIDGNSLPEIRKREKKRVRINDTPSTHRYTRGCF